MRCVISNSRGFVLNFSASAGRSPFNGCGLLASRFVGWVVEALLGWGGILFLALF